MEAALKHCRRMSFEGGPCKALSCSLCLVFRMHSFESLFCVHFVPPLPYAWRHTPLLCISPDVDEVALKVQSASICLATQLRDAGLGLKKATQSLAWHSFLKRVVTSEYELLQRFEDRFRNRVPGNPLPSHTFCGLQILSLRILQASAPRQTMWFWRLSNIIFFSSLLDP